MLLGWATGLRCILRGWGAARHAPGQSVEQAGKGVPSAFPAAFLAEKIVHGVVARDGDLRIFVQTLAM